MQVGVKISTFNWKMRRARQAAGLSQVALGELCDIAGTRINGIECLRENVSERTAEKICTVLGGFPEEMFPLECRKVNRKLTRTIEFATEVASLSQLPDLKRTLLAPSPEEALDTKELGAAIETVLKMLSFRERRVLEMHYGFRSTDNEPISYEGIGTAMGITRERARQIEQKALRKLRHPIRRKYLPPIA